MLNVGSDHFLLGWELIIYLNFLLAFFGVY